MSIVKIVLEVPEERSRCADWLKGENPMVVADALSLTESAYGLLKRNIVSSGYSNGYEEELDNQKKKFEEMLNKMEEDYKRDVSRKENDAEVKISKISKEYEKELSRVKEMSERNELVLSERLNMMKDQEKEIKGEVSKMFENQMNCYERTIKSHEERNKELQEILKEKDVMFAKLNEDKQQQAEDYVRRFENMNKLLTGTAANKGLVGENFVQDVFSNSMTKMGYLEDTRYTSNVGCEDFMWKWTPANGMEMLCSVEVKNSERLHSADITKHHTRINEASNAGKINCGLFLSLKCKIQNTNAIEVKMLSGVPVLYVSKTDNLTSTNVVEIGFALMGLLWENTKMSECNSEDEEGENKLREMSGKFVEMVRNQFEHLSMLNNQIDDMEKSANSLLKQSQKMRKVRMGMLSNITSFQTSYPEMFVKTEASVEEQSVDNDELVSYSMEEVMSMAEASGMIDAIKDFNAKRGSKYPKSMDQLKSFFEKDEQYQSSMKLTAKLGDIVNKMKKDKPRAKRSKKEEGSSSEVRSLTIDMGSQNGSEE